MYKFNYLPLLHSEQSFFFQTPLPLCELSLKWMVLEMLDLLGDTQEVQVPPSKYQNKNMLLHAHLHTETLTFLKVRKKPYQHF